jgi:predicted ATPase with chaperone activity
VSRPDEVNLAHHGVLFPDDCDAFKRDVQNWNDTSHIVL